MSEDVEKATYEQCPYDWEHVSQIYRNILEEPPETAEWLRLRSGNPSTRLRRHAGYFQFFYGDPETSLYQELHALEPMQTTDDAEWEIEKHGEHEYLVRSKFSTTFGPCVEQQKVDELVQRFGALLDCRESYVSATATFTEVAAGPLLDACRRLVTLEAWCMEANRGITRMLDEYWGAIRAGLSTEMESGKVDLRAEFYGGKKREPYVAEEG